VTETGELEKDMAKVTWKNVFLTLLMPVVLFIILCIINPKNYLHGSMIIMLIQQCLPNLIIGWSMLYGMSVGLFDFSAGARFLFAGMLGIYFSQICGFAGMILACMIASIVMGYVVGITYSALRIPSIIAGFAWMLIIEAVGVMVQNRISMTIDGSYLLFGRTVPEYLLTLVVFVIVYISFNRTKFGYQIKAIGGDENIARSMGINSGRLKLMTYVVGGAILGFGSIVYLSSNGTVTMATGMASMNKCFTPMMGVMIGQLLTCCNPVIGVFIGELSITMVSSGLIALHVPSRLQNTFIGIFLIAFMAFQINRELSNARKKQAVVA
jgi:ribose transport system permease protein